MRSNSAPRSSGRCRCDLRRRRVSGRLAQWVGIEKAAAPFWGGPFIDRAYFGEGLAIAVRKNNSALRAALDYGLARLAERAASTPNSISNIFPSALQNVKTRTPCKQRRVDEHLPP